LPDFYNWIEIDNLWPCLATASSLSGKMKKINTSNWDKVSKRIVLGLIVSALVAAFFLLLGVYIVGAEALAGFVTAYAEGVADVR
jgi:hypothetical protein